MFCEECRGECIDLFNEEIVQETGLAAYMPDLAWGARKCDLEGVEQSSSSTSLILFDY